MKFGNAFRKQQNDSVLQMVADGHGLSRTAPQLLSPPRASADALFSPNAPPHHQKPCGCLRAQTAARCPAGSADGGAVQAGRDARGGASERVAHARPCTGAEDTGVDLWRCGAHGTHGMRQVAWGWEQGGPHVPLAQREAA